MPVLMCGCWLLEKPGVMKTFDSWQVLGQALGVVRLRNLYAGHCKELVPASGPMGASAEAGLFWGGGGSPVWGRT